MRCDMYVWKEWRDWLIENKNARFRVHIQGVHIQGVQIYDYGVAREVWAQLWRLEDYVVSSSLSGPSVFLIKRKRI